MNSAEQLQKRIREEGEEYCDVFLTQEPWSDMTAGYIYQRAFKNGADSLAPLLLEMAETLKKSGTTHLECDDGWYSCPLAENYSIESNQGTPGICNCGAQIRIEALASFQRFLAKGGE